MSVCHDVGISNNTATHHVSLSAFLYSSITGRVPYSRIIPQHSALLHCTMRITFQHSRMTCQHARNSVFWHSSIPAFQYPHPSVAESQHSSIPAFQHSSVFAFQCSIMVVAGLVQCRLQHFFTNEWF